MDKSLAVSEIEYFFSIQLMRHTVVYVKEKIHPDWPLSHVRLLGRISHQGLVVTGAVSRLGFDWNFNGRQQCDRHEIFPPSKLNDTTTYKFVGGARVAPVVKRSIEKNWRNCGGSV